jgi:hypothetical protein
VRENRGSAAFSVVVPADLHDRAGGRDGAFHGKNNGHAEWANGEPPTEAKVRAQSSSEASDAAFAARAA